VQSRRRYIASLQRRHTLIKPTPPSATLTAVPASQVLLPVTPVSLHPSYILLLLLLLLRGCGLFGMMKSVDVNETQINFQCFDTVGWVAGNASGS